MDLTLRIASLAAAALLCGCGGPAKGETDAEDGPASGTPDGGLDDPEPGTTPPPDAAGKEEPLPGDPSAGAEIYAAYCVACHMPDGTGLKGTLAADWIGDPTRRAKSDAELLQSIAEGIDETTMVAWSAILSEQQRKDALAYVRVTFMGHSGRR